MLEALDLQTEVQGIETVALPLRLPPWLENPYRLVSLWDISMVVCSGEKLFWSGAAIEALKSECFMRAGVGEAPLPNAYFAGPVDAATIEKTIGWLTTIRSQCELLGMPVSAETIGDLQAILAASGKQSYQSLQNRLHSIKDVIRKELTGKAFLYIAPERVRFWPSQQTPYIFGEQVWQSFPSTIYDVHEAGVCLALSRCTAAVFHLIRVMEAALKVLANELGIPYAPSWESYIRQLTAIFESDWKKRAPELQQKQPIYKDFLGDLQSVKIAWRNPTMHIVKKYDPDEAEQIFNAVKQFMMRIADAGLREQGAVV